jgi:hypothetical protein
MIIIIIILLTAKNKHQDMVTGFIYEISFSKLDLISLALHKYTTLNTNNLIKY